MGYYVNIVDSTIFIKKDFLDKAYELMCKLNETNNNKSGGSFIKKKELDQNTPHDGIWFSWMPWNYPEKCKDAAEILSYLGFETYYDDSGNLVISNYDSKIGDEAYFLESLAPLMEDHTYVHWRGEDGEEWRHYFLDNKMIHQSIEKIVWYPDLDTEPKQVTIDKTVETIDKEFTDSLDNVAKAMDILMKKINDIKDKA